MDQEKKMKAVSKGVSGGNSEIGEYSSKLMCNLVCKRSNTEKNWSKSFHTEMHEKSSKMSESDFKAM